MFQGVRWHYRTGNRWLQCDVSCCEVPPFSKGECSVQKKGGVLFLGGDTSVAEESVTDTTFGQSQIRFPRYVLATISRFRAITTIACGAP